MRQQEILDIIERKCPAAVQYYKGQDKPEYMPEAVADYVIRQFIHSKMGFPDYEMFESIIYKPFETLTEWEQEILKEYYDKWGVKDLKDNEIV